MPTWIEASLQDAVAALIRSGEREIASALGRLLGEPQLKSIQLYRAPELEELADEIFDCDTLETLHTLLPRICELFAAEHCTIHCVRERSPLVSGPKVLTTYPAAWIGEYVNRRYSTIDPVLLRCHEEPGTFFWDELAPSSPIAVHFMRSAAEHGVGPAGVTFVQEAAEDNVFAVTMASTEAPEVFRSSFSRRLSDFQDIASLLVDVFSELTSSSDQTAGAPSDDQLKVLRGLIRGKSIEELETLHFSYGSFATVKTSILKTFGAKTLAQAAALAVKRGLLEDLPYFHEDIYAEAPAGRSPHRWPARLRDAASAR